MADPERWRPARAFREFARSVGEARRRAQQHASEPSESPSRPPSREEMRPRGEEEEGDLLRQASDIAWRLLIVGVLIAVLVWLLSYISIVVIPVVLAVFLTALLTPMAHWLRLRGLGRGSSTAVSFLGALVAFGLVLYLIIDRAIAGVPALLESVNDAVAGLQEGLIGLGMDAEVLTNFLDQVQAEVQGWLTETLEDNAQELLTGAWTAAVGVGQIVVAVILVLVLTIYFVHSGDRLMEWVGTLLPGGPRRTLQESAGTAYTVMGRYVRGVALVGLFDAVGIGLLLLGLSMFGLFDLNLAIPLIVLTFIGAFLPVVGAFVTGALAAAVAWVTGGWVVGLVVLGWVIFIQQLESNLFAPRIYGRALQLPSPVVLLGISVGAIAANLIGMFLATPVLAVIAALLRNRPGVAAEREAGQGSGNRDDPRDPGSKTQAASGARAADTTQGEEGPAGSERP